MAAFQTDDSLWPLLIIRLEGRLSQEEMEALLAQRLRYLERGCRHVFLCDLSASHHSLAEHRHRVAQWIAEHEEPLNRLSAGSVYILHSPLLRVAFQVVIWLKPVRFPVLVAEDMRTALEWAAERFREAGLHTPAQRVLEWLAQCSAR